MVRSVRSAPGSNKVAKISRGHFVGLMMHGSDVLLKEFDRFEADAYLGLYSRVLSRLHLGKSTTTAALCEAFALSRASMQASLRVLVQHKLLSIVAAPAPSGGNKPQNEYVVLASLIERLPD